jgi:uncharacterized protein DUF3592
MRVHLEPGNLITVLVGVLFIAAGLYSFHHMGHFLDHARETSGVIVDVVYETGSKKGRIHPRVRFNTEAGREIVAQSDTHHNVQPGETVRLLYDPRRPEDFEITTIARAQNRRLLFTLLSVALGIGVCVMGLRMKLHG